MNELLNTLAAEFTDREYAQAYLSENSNMRIAAQVRALRLSKGWTQNDLAEIAGMRQGRISKIEEADFESLTLTTLRRLAEAFDSSLSVKFESVHEAVLDFVSLSDEKLKCKDWDDSLKILAATPISNPSALTTRTTTKNFSIPATGVAISSKVKIEA